MYFDWQNETEPKNLWSKIPFYEDKLYILQVYIVKIHFHVSNRDGHQNVSDYLFVYFNLGNLQLFY